MNNTKNKLSDLNDHLFMEIERLGDEDLAGEELAREISRAKAVCDVAGQIIAGGRLVLDAAKAADGCPEIGRRRLLLE
jgi:hypothetical protein